MTSLQITILSVLACFAFISIGVLARLIFYSTSFTNIPPESKAIVPVSTAIMPIATKVELQPSWTPGIIIQPYNTTKTIPPTKIPTLRPTIAPSIKPIQSKDPDAYHISGDSWFGCSDREYFHQLVEYIVDQDDQALEQALTDGILYGECTLFSNGEQVYLKETAIFSGLVKIRRQGETQEFWTFAEAVESNR
jgi:hypothetical protein